MPGSHPDGILAMPRHRPHSAQNTRAVQVEFPGQKEVSELVVNHLEVPATHTNSRQHIVLLHACGCASVKLVRSLTCLDGQCWHQGCLGWELAVASNSCRHSNILRTACEGAGHRNGGEQLKHVNIKRRSEWRVLIEFGLQAQASLLADLLIVHESHCVQARSRSCS